MNSFIGPSKNEPLYFEWSPTLTDYSDIVYSTFASIYETCSGILPDIVSGICSDIISDILSGILPGIYSGIHCGIFSGIYSDILSGILSDNLFGILSERYIYLFIYLYYIIYMLYIYILSFYLALSFWWSVLAQPDPELAMGSGPCPDCTGQLRLPLVPGKGQKCQGAQWHMWRIWHPRNLRWEKPGSKLRKVAAEEPMLYAIWLARCLTVALATS